MTPKEYIRKFGMELEKLNINNFTYSDSSTLFGNSSYLMVAGFKVRASDHSVTSVTRIMNEMHLCEMTFEFYLSEIERFFFPESFCKVETIEFSNAFEFPKDKIQTINCEFKVIEDCSYVTKKGRVMSIISRKNVIKTSYNRI